MTHDWAGATGQGVKENEGVESFDAGVMQYCKYYFYLHDIIVDIYVLPAHWKIQRTFVFLMKQV